MDQFGPLYDWAYWAQLNYRLGQEPSMYGASDHLLYIGYKDTEVA